MEFQARQTPVRCGRCADTRPGHAPPLLAGVEFDGDEARVLRPVRDALPFEPRLYLTTNSAPQASNRVRWIPVDGPTLQLSCRDCGPHDPRRRSRLVKQARSGSVVYLR